MRSATWPACVCQKIGEAMLVERDLLVGFATTQNYRCVTGPRG